MKRRYAKIRVLDEFKRKMKLEATEKGYPSMIAYQEAILNKDEPIINTIFSKRKKKKNEFII